MASPGLKKVGWIPVVKWTRSLTAELEAYGSSRVNPKILVDFNARSCPLVYIRRYIEFDNG
jgi:hypothetical protein